MFYDRNNTIEKRKKTQMFIKTVFNSDSFI